MAPRSIQATSMPSGMADMIPPDAMIQAEAEKLVGPKSGWGPAFNGAWSCTTKATAAARAGGSMDSVLSGLVACAKDYDKKSKQVPLMIAGAAIGGLAIGALVMHLTMKK
jgi:hypothetical protein